MSDELFTLAQARRAEWQKEIMVSRQLRAENQRLMKEVRVLRHSLKIVRAFVRAQVPPAVLPPPLLP